jgi:hypothetical protein
MSKQLPKLTGQLKRNWDAFLGGADDEIDADEVEAFIALSITEMESIAISQAVQAERTKALEIAKSCIINLKFGSPYPLVITEKMYEQVLKVGMSGVEALTQESK